MYPKATSTHEGDNRQSVEPEFVVASNPTPLSRAGAEKPVRGSRSKSKEASKDTSIGSKEGKRGVAASSKSPLMRGKVSDTNVADVVPPESNAESNVKSEGKSEPVPTMILAFANASAPKEGLV